ncbi:MAG: hypothetical protein HGGPFJEG_02962 [Ignavibacteria bacterium]|nr:hypothetical protein [Ignavibacteria bacterium]
MKNENDIEVLGFIVSCYSYGNVSQINRFAAKLTERTGNNFYEFTSNYSEHKDKKFLSGLNYRFNSEKDLSELIKRTGKILRQYKSLKNAFAESYDEKDADIIPALTEFVSLFKNEKKISNSFGYLVPSPADNSACKRLNLFLRWMVRKDEIDFGIWSNVINKAKLIMPVDTHVYKISRELKLINRKSCDLKFAVELTNRLKKFDESDPVKYDFALCHYGMEREE